MHELPVTESVLHIALEHAGHAGARRITGVYLVIGQLSSIVDDSVQFYWDILTRGTAAEGSLLHFRRTHGEFLCLDCGTRYAPDGRDMSCPACQSRLVRIVGGEEFMLESIDIEEGEPFIPKAGANL